MGSDSNETTFTTHSAVNRNKTARSTDAIRPRVASSLIRPALVSRPVVSAATTMAIPTVTLNHPADATTPAESASRAYAPSQSDE